MLSLLRKFVRPAHWVWKMSNVFSRENLLTLLDRELLPLTQLPRPVDVLNIGAGGELGGRVAAVANARVQTIDVDPQRGPDLVADVTDLSMFEDRSFDVAFLLEILEHVKQPERAAREIRRVLKPGGKVVVSTPFMLEIHEAPHDYYRFTRYGLEHLFREFEDVKITARSRYIKSALVPLLRLWKSPFWFDRFIGLILLISALILYPLVKLFDVLIRSDTVTAGYFLVARRPKE